jgi:hypothetical protein
MDIVCDDNYRPLIKDGVYEVQCLRYDDGFCLGEARKLFLHFQIITEGEYHGMRLFHAFNLPYNMKIKAGSKYYKTWVMVNGWMKPSKNAKMSPRLFLNKVFKVRTRTVKPKHNDKLMPESFHYSVVDELIEVIAG